MKLDQRRRLSDLYARGEELELAPGEVVYIKKMTPADAEVAYLKASARRSSILAMARSDEPSDLYDMIKGEVDQLSRESLITWAASTQMVEQTPLIESRVAGEEEWSKERYLESLQERFSEDDFTAKLKEDPENEEVKRVLGELERYNKQVEEESAKVSEEIEAQLGEESLGELQDKVIESMLEAQGNAAWLNEFSKCQVWRCTYEGEDHSQRVWPERSDIDEVQAELLEKIREVVDKIHVSDAEGKDSGVLPVSSPPSE